MGDPEADKIRRDLRARGGRLEGNLEYNDLEREAARLGRASNPRDIPAQDGSRRQGTVNVNPGSDEFQPSTVYTRGEYRIGNPQRPDIRHDDGFASFARQQATWSDRLALIQWYAKLEVAEAVRPDLTDALAAYRHYHEGNGRDREFSYDRYVNNDHNGRITFRNAVLEAQLTAIELFLGENRNAFCFTGPAIPCGSSIEGLAYLHPYPSTENWQKAIGAHVIWLSGRVTVTPGQSPRFSLDLTIHAEDQYNFNPGQEDIATGLPDDANGRFEVIGWAHGYRNNATLRRSFSWTGYELGVPSLAINPPRRARQPNDNRRARNRM